MEFDVCKDEFAAISTRGTFMNVGLSAHSSMRQSLNVYIILNMVQEENMRDFFISCSELYFGFHKLVVDDDAERIISEFIHSSAILLLQGFVENGTKLIFTISIHSDKKESIVFYKDTSQVLTGAGSVNNVNILTLSNTVTESLYQIVRHVYTPLLAVVNNVISDRIKQNLSELESNLKILTHGKGVSGNFHIILTIEDEIDYWKSIIEKKDINNKEREAATAFGELFEEINDELKSIKSVAISEVQELTENLVGLLDDVWRHSVSAYPQDRMKHIMDIVGHTLVNYLQETLSSLDMWKVCGDSSDNDIIALLSNTLSVIQVWTSACNSLTLTYWPNLALHPWNGKPYVPTFSLQFQDRLNEIYQIRSTHHQLNKLLTSAEKLELNTNQMFEPFKKTNTWTYTSEPKKLWDNAISKFSANLKPAENKIAEKLKPRLHNSSTKQMLYEFMRYKTLIERPLVKQAMQKELEAFLASLESFLKNIKIQIETDDTSDLKMYQPPEMSYIVHKVQWAKQIESKVNDIRDCAEKYLFDLEGSQGLLSLSAQVLEELKNICTQLHEDWSLDLQAQVKNGSLQLSLDKPVVEFSSSNRMMVVHFNPRLVAIELEARGMSALGHPPPASVKEAIDNVARFLQHARSLQQIASFHNTLGERMIPSTRPMMLQAALGLSSLVQEQKAVYWTNLEQVTHYSDMLKKAVVKLESQNSYLTSEHIAIRSIVESLLDTDLLAKQGEWKKKVKDVRDAIEKVEASGYKNTELWREHWDWQLYKVLECQYTKTLLSLHKHFPHVKVDLVLRGRSVCLQPPIEEIRVQHYHQLRRLISLPAQFVGLKNTIKDTGSIFADIVEKHGWLGNKSVRQLENTLSAVEATCTEWTRRAALACVADLDGLCREHLREPQDWELNFKACKAYGQAVAKMSFEDERIDWISIGTVTLRREFEAQVRNLWGCLISSLQASCHDDAVFVDSFIANATLTLESKVLPKNARELSEISAKQRSLQEKMPEIESTVEGLKRKSHLLRTWGGDQSIDGTIREWQKVHELMLSQQQLFAHQAEIVKSSLSGEWSNLDMSIETFASRWTQGRLRFEEKQSPQYAEMWDRCQQVMEGRVQWEKFVADRDELLKECEKFDMKQNLSEAWKQTEVMVNEDLKLWTVFMEYNDEYKSFAEKEWIMFQKKTHLIDEFITKWKARLEPYTTVTLFIQQELDKYSDLTVLLKYLRGTNFTERHWREVFSVLEMEYKKPDTLQVQDFLDVSLNIKKQIKILQKISASAASESAIRGALNELELWFAGARLVITYYNDKAGQATPIVKYFKEITSKIEEQQWIVGSVRGTESGGTGSTDACAVWQTRLRTASDLVRATHHAQRRWLYLEPILSGDSGELGAKFRKVDLGFRQVARLIEADSRLSALVQSARLQPMLDTISEQLHTCQAALNQYIDDKRSTFPRFYFLSDDDLLELLGQARAGAEGRAFVMQTHLRKLFPGITGVKLGPDDLSVTALCSHHHEIFNLDHPVDIDCPVEVWLKNLENEMRCSLKNLVLNCLTTTCLQDQNVFSLPVQILCLAQNIRYTEQTERAIKTKELQKFKAHIEKEHNYYASIETDDENERLKRQALILQCTYSKNVIQLLIDNNVAATGQWLWQKQLRFYLLSNKEVVVKMGLAELSYSYEYLGINTGQFARTELSDQCFLILTQAFHLGLVGNPFGPAGTGKTESVKALGGLVGRLVLVFNCDEAMDGECMGRLLSGLARCGAWGCFDELNRLTAQTLAALSHHLGELLNVLADHVSAAQRYATINGNQIAVSEWCAVAATMNPVGRGYGGRRALPTALQRVLRPVAMCHPRGDMLARHLLAARAVLHSQRLADDLHQVFYMASELLSVQRHYDWGLRALKATVGSCGDALAVAPPDRQRAVLRAALRLNNMSKLTREDANRFESILSIVFTGVPEEELPQSTIGASLEASVKSLGLIYNEEQIQKCMQLHEQLQQRMGVVLVGPPGSGKTTIRQLLKLALLKQGTNIVEYVICPKAMSRSCLLGQIDADTRQWTDGVISATALEVSNQPDDVWSWVVCDGDIEPEWVEALNSVLDDNRLLTLPSGWRVQFGPRVNFLFETHTLEHASPATVSRMGVILFSEDTHFSQEILDTWLQNHDFENETVKTALALLQKVIKKCLQWYPSHRSDFVVKIYMPSMVKQILTQFQYVASNINSTIVTTPEDLIYFAIQRSVNGCLKQNYTDSLQKEMAELLGVPPILSPHGGEWRGESIYMSTRLARVEPALRAALDAKENGRLLVIGPPACAKNILSEYVLRDTNHSLIINIDCTPILEPSDIIEELKRKNIVRVGGRGSARNEDSGAVLLVRSLHRAPIDIWGSSPVQAFLLQIIQHGGFWEQTGNVDGGRNVQWCGVGRMRIVTTANSHTVRLCPRLTNALCVFSLKEPDADELLELTKNSLMQNINHKDIANNEMSSLANKMLAVYKDVQDSLFDTEIHYKWNACDIKRWCDNIRWYTSTNSEEFMSIIEAEANCIFKDRLMNNQDKAAFNAILKKHLKITNTNGIYFTSKLRGTGVYMEPTDYRTWYQTTQKAINQCISEQEYSIFGDTGAEVCGELAILCPAMARATNGGVMVCVGSAGVGLRAAAHVVASTLPAALYSVNFSTEFNMQMKNALSSAGGEGNRTLVMVCESAVEPTTLGAIEALMRARSVYSLPRELLPVLSHNHHPAQFLQNLKQNLGIIIILHKDQENLAKLLEKFPFLCTASHFVWLDRWSNETLRQMPQLIIQRLMKENIEENDMEVNESIPVDGFVSIYNALELDWMKAPCRYVNFVKTYYHIVRRKKTALTERQNMLATGVEALRRARSEVGALQEDATHQEAALSEKRASATHALEQIGATVRAATRSKDDMHALKRNIEVENEKLQIRKKEIEVELAAVEPVIAAARAAVGDIKPESLSEVRSLRAPPDVVRDVLEGVLRLMGIADTSWHSMKNFLSKRGVKEDIRCLDASQISPEAAQSVRRLLEKRGTSFEERVAKRASAACAPLAAWVRANLAHAEVLARVQPLQTQQRDLHKSLQEAEGELSALSNGLEDVEGRVSSLQEQLGLHTRDAAALELKLAKATDTLSAARDLLQRLAAEYEAWETDLEHIVKEIAELNLRSLLASAYIVYLAESAELEIKDYIAKWSQLIGFEDAEFSVINFLSTTEKQLKWDADGLPLDKSALKNAILVDQFLESKKCGLTPLIIDPDGDAMEWMKNSWSDLPCDFISQQSQKLLTATQQATRFGRILVVTEVERVHPYWAPLLSGLPPSTGTGTSALHPGIRLLLYSRDPTLPARLGPSHRAMISVLDFSARVDGLTDQLVHFALQHENPEVNEKSRELKVKKATLQKQQHELQENLLTDLSKNVDILHDANLLESLNKTRYTSATIADALAAARAVEERTNASCGAYEPSARCAAELALAVRQLAAHWPLVNLPIDALLHLFTDAMAGSRHSKDPENMNNDQMIKHLMKRVIERVLLALHKKDKYIVVLHLLKQTHVSLIPDDLWQLFIKNNEKLIEDSNVKEISQKYHWVQSELIKNVAMLQNTSDELMKKLSLDNSQLWKEFQKSGDLGALTKLKLTSFEIVVAVATLRPETLYRAITMFVDQALGVGVMSAGDEVGRAARWGAGGAGRPPRPLLMLGAHVADQIAAYAAAHARTLHQIWVGEGPSSWEAGVERARGGGWLVLALGAAPFTADLCTFLGTFSQREAAEFSPEFRLWVVCEDRDVPPLVANACVNVVLEAPEGVKNNALNTLSAWGTFENPDPSLVRTLACLALFHALVQERRAYIPEGWSQWYSFEWGDVSACRRLVVQCGSSGRTSAAGLCEALYQGRVAAQPDSALLAALVRDALGEHTLAHAWTPRGLDTALPHTNKLQAYAAALSGLPALDGAELLGLAPNCRVAWETKAADDILLGLKELHTTVDATSKNDKDTPLKYLLALWKKLMSGSPFVKGHLAIETGKGWWSCVCTGEAEEAMRAVRLVHGALVAAKDGQAKAPLHKVPDDWLMQWPGPDVPQRYLRELAHRARHAATRLTPAQGTLDDHYFPAELDLRSFLNPRRVLAALRARAAARLRCAPDALLLDVKWDCPSASGEDNAVVVVGLRLSGAIWGRTLEPAPPRAPPHAPAPPLLLRYTNKGGHSAATALPVYTSETREQLVCRVQAPPAVATAASLDGHALVLNAVALFVAEA